MQEPSAAILAHQRAASVPSARTCNLPCFVRALSAQHAGRDFSDCNVVVLRAPRCPIMCPAVFIANDVDRCLLHDVWLGAARLKRTPTRNPTLCAWHNIDTLVWEANSAGARVEDERLCDLHKANVLVPGPFVVAWVLVDFACHSGLARFFKHLDLVSPGHNEEVRFSGTVRCCDHPFLVDQHPSTKRQSASRSLNKNQSHLPTPLTPVGILSTDDLYDGVADLCKRFVARRKRGSRRGTLQAASIPANLAAFETRGAAHTYHRCCH